jgi:nucleotide-binding universal stress UspA family protein
MAAIRSIVHPTDFSDLSAAAFAHALRIALAGRSKLHLLHVSQYDVAEALAFPHAVRFKLQEPTRAIVNFLSEDESELVVIATHGRDGVSHWLQGSMAEAVFRRSAIPTLFIAPGARGFVDQVSGDVKLRRALVPVDFSPPADRTVDIIQRFGQLLTGATIAVDLLHVGEAPPPVHAASSNAPALPPVMLRSGHVVQSIVEAAIELDADIIAMPTAGHHGVLDALRGSTTERVIRHAPCPVLALPVASRR